jgi:hypothetical protein
MLKARELSDLNKLVLEILLDWKTVMILGIIMLILQSLPASSTMCQKPSILEYRQKKSKL